jgi:hypothetical protein
MIPDPGSASKYLSIFNHKNCFEALGNTVLSRKFIPGPDFDFFSLDPGPGSRGQKRHRIQIRNTVNDLLSLKNDVDVPIVNNKHKKNCEKS